MAWSDRWSPCGDSTPEQLPVSKTQQLALPQIIKKKLIWNKSFLTAAEEEKVKMIKYFTTNANRIKRTSVTPLEGRDPYVGNNQTIVIMSRRTRLWRMKLRILLKYWSISFFSTKESWSYHLAPPTIISILIIGHIFFTSVLREKHFSHSYESITLFPSLISYLFRYFHLIFIT